MAMDNLQVPNMEKPNELLRDAVALGWELSLIKYLDIDSFSEFLTAVISALCCEKAQFKAWGRTYFRLKSGGAGSCMAMTKDGVRIIHLYNPESKRFIDWKIACDFPAKASRVQPNRPRKYSPRKTNG